MKLLIEYSQQAWDQLNSSSEGTGKSKEAKLPTNRLTEAKLEELIAKVTRAVVANQIATEWDIASLESTLKNHYRITTGTNRIILKVTWDRELTQVYVAAILPLNPDL